MVKTSESLKEIGQVLRRPGYLALAVGVASVIVMMFALIPNWGLLTSSFSIKLWWGLMGSLKTNLRLMDQVVLGLSAALAGVQVSLLVAHLKCKVKMGQAAGLSAIGIVSSLLGVGCSACGSIILTSLIGLSGTAVLHSLPFRGMELGILGILILVVSIVMTAKKISEANACVLTAKRQPDSPKTR